MGVVTGNRIKAFARLAVALAFVIVVALIATGVVDAGALEAAVTSALAIAGLVLVWWKDNNVTIRAIARHLIPIADDVTVKEIVVEADFEEE